MLDQARRVLSRPSLAVAGRSACAAMLAWLLVLPLPGVADHYPYYAPLGAVVATSTSVISSLRTASGTFLALLAGTLVGLGAQALPAPDVVALGLAVAVGTLVAVPAWFAAMASWVPISALFVLILGGGEPGHFVLGYLGLTTLGAVVGLSINLVFPPLLLAQTARAQEALRSVLVEQIEALAQMLREAPEEERARADTAKVRARARAVEDLDDHATGGPPVNWRLRRWQRDAARLREQGRALTFLAFVTQDLVDVLLPGGPAGRAAWPMPVRPAAAVALDATAELLRQIDGATVATETWEATTRANRELARVVRTQPASSDAEVLSAGALADAVRRALEAVAPRDVDDHPEGAEAHA